MICQKYDRFRLLSIFADDWQETSFDVPWNIFDCTLQEGGGGGGGGYIDISFAFILHMRL